MKRLLFIIALIGSVATCEPATSTVYWVDPTGARRTQTIHLDDPHGDLVAALAVGDQRFIGLMGYARQLPGINPEQQRKLELVAGVKTVEGISDMKTPASARLERPARAYAIVYNQELRQKLFEMGLLSD